MDTEGESVRKTGSYASLLLLRTLKRGCLWNGGFNRSHHYLSYMRIENVPFSK